MKKWVSLLIVLAAALLEAMLADRFKLFGAKPELLLITLVILTGFFLFQLRWLLVLALISGIFKDTFSADTFGVNTLLFCCWAVIIAKFSRKISIDDNLRRAILMFAVALLQSIGTGILLTAIGNPVSWGIFLRISFFSALYTLMVALLVFRIPQFRF